MKKYVLFMLLVLIGMGVNASTQVNLTLEEPKTIDKFWSYQVVTDAKTKIQKGDFLIVSFDEASAGNQYAICNEKGDKIYTKGADEGKDYYNCAAGQKDFTLTVDQDLYTAIQNGGLRLEYNGLNNLKVSAKRVDEDWTSYKPKGSNVTEIMSTPWYIKDWYSNASYVLKTNHDYVGKTLRVVCLETGDDAYAFLKKNDSDWPTLMSGSDKFSIAGWKYFEIKINEELNKLLRGVGLRIGGNNYYIAGIYVYGDGTSAPDWKEEESDVVDTYTFASPVDGTSGWKSADIPGSFFEFEGQAKGQQGSAAESTKKLANTKNNIIRLILEGAVSKTQVSAKDNNAEKVDAAYIRQRHYNDNGSFYYTDYADCGAVDHFDFELSDAITVFENYDKPKLGADGVKTGMLSTLLLNGMNVGVNGAKITKLEIRKSMVSKYVTGYAIYKGHHLSNTYWRSVALPYNLSREQLKQAFGDDVVICELGKSAVTKKVTKEDENKITYNYGISFNFTKIPDTEGINANYPYMIKLKNGVKENDLYPIENVKADVRDYQAYEFRTSKFDLNALNAQQPTTGDAQYDKLQKIYQYEQEIKNSLNENVRMIFKSTAPVFDITNTGVGDVEIINATNNKTKLDVPTNNAGATNYYLYNNVLYPVKDFAVNLSSGLAYVVFPAATQSLFENQPDATQAGAKITYFFGDENETTGIEDIDMAPASVGKAQQNVYSLNGQLVRQGLSVEGLAKGIYIVNGKKVIIK